MCAAAGESAAHKTRRNLAAMPVRSASRTDSSQARALVSRPPNSLHFTFYFLILPFLRLAPPFD